MSIAASACKHNLWFRALSGRVALPAPTRPRIQDAAGDAGPVSKRYFGYDADRGCELWKQNPPSPSVQQLARQRRDAFNALYIQLRTPKSPRITLVHGPISQVGKDQNHLLVDGQDARFSCIASLTERQHAPSLSRSLNAMKVRNQCLNLPTSPPP